MQRRIVVIILIVSFCIVAADAWPVSYDVNELRDPFESLLPEQTRKTTDLSTLPKLQIEGLVWGSAVPEAIINGEVVKVGGEINGAKILDISKEGVTVIFEGRIYEIKPQKSLK